MKSVHITLEEAIARGHGHITPRKPGRQDFKALCKELAEIFLPVSVVFMVVGVFSQDDPQAMLALVIGIVCLLIKDNF